jgi:formate--tetrahydrofolate ligase
MICGDIMTMPGLPKRPSAMDIDVDDDGNIRPSMRMRRL